METTQYPRKPMGMPLVLIRGAGDLASGIAIRLHRCGFPVLMTEIARPLVVRRTVAFAQAIYDGATDVEEVRAVRSTKEHALNVINSGAIPVLVDPDASRGLALQPDVLIDAVMAKTNTGTRLDQAPFVVGVGPGFEAGVDCHVVIETNRGHNLGRVIWQGKAEANTGTPGSLPGAARGLQRAVYAPSDGRLRTQLEIGDTVNQNDVLAEIVSNSGEVYRVRAQIDGVLRGIIHPSVDIVAGLKIGDIDPRSQRLNCFTVSDKSLSVGGGALEAILSAMHRGLFTPSSTLA